MVDILLARTLSFTYYFYLLLLAAPLHLFLEVYTCLFDDNLSETS